MTPPPSREPGQAGVTDALERRLRNEVSIHVSLSGEDELSRDILALLADRTQREERITKLEKALEHWGGDGKHMGISKVDPVTCPSCVKARALLGEVQDDQALS